MALHVPVWVGQIAGRGDRRPESHLYSRLKASLHVHALVVVLELCLRAEDHEKELLAGVVRELLSVRTHLHNELLVHEIHNGSQVSCVSRKAVWVPCEDGVESAFLDLSNQLVEDRTLTCILGGMGLSLYVHHFDAFSLGELKHLLYLRINGKRLFLITFRRLSRI